MPVGLVTAEFAAHQEIAGKAVVDREGAFLQILSNAGI